MTLYNMREIKATLRQAEREARNLYAFFPDRKDGARIIGGSKDRVLTIHGTYLHYDSTTVFEVR